MIYFSFRINWPFKKYNRVDLILKTWRLSKHKRVELQISKGVDTIIGAEFSIMPLRTDHAGFSLGIDLLRCYIGITFYDHRHWDHENNCWEKEEDE